MKENQSDTKPAATEGGQQNKTNRNDQNGQSTPGNKPNNPNTEMRGEEGTETNKEYQETGHQHDYKTPVGEQNRQNTDQKNSRQETPSATGKQGGSEMPE